MNPDRAAALPAQTRRLAIPTVRALLAVIVGRPMLSITP